MIPEQSHPAGPLRKSFLRATKAGNPAPTRPAAALSPRAAPGSRPNRNGAADRHLTATPAVAPAPMLAPSATNPAPAPDRESAVAVAVLDTTAQLQRSPATNLQNRARSKYLTAAIVKGLTGLGELTPLRFAYASTMRCAAELVQDGTKVQGKYCRQRWCLCCNRIRTAKLIAGYLPEMATWPDPHFVTLTIPNVQGPQLHAAVRKMLAAMRPIARAIRHTDGLELRAVRKLETTYNIRRRDYHPHFHLIANTRHAADAMVRYWLKRFPDATPAAQDVRPCKGPGATKELFKYFTKLVVKGLDGERTAPPPLALDTMFKAVKGLRTFQSMGFKSRVTVDADDEALELDAGTVSPIAPDSRGVVRWTWAAEMTDWMDYGSGELLSGYTPSAKMKALVNRITADARAAPA